MIEIQPRCVWWIPRYGRSIDSRKTTRNTDDTEYDNTIKPTKYVQEEEHKHKIKMETINFILASNLLTNFTESPFSLHIHLNIIR